MDLKCIICKTFKQHFWFKLIFLFWNEEKSVKNGKSVMKIFSDACITFSSHIICMKEKMVSLILVCFLRLLLFWPFLLSIGFAQISNRDVQRWLVLLSEWHLQNIGKSFKAFFFVIQFIYKRVFAMISHSQM